jgi:hypothetical protein
MYLMYPGGKIVKSGNVGRLGQIRIKSFEMALSDKQGIL